MYQALFDAIEQNDSNRFIWTWEQNLPFVDFVDHPGDARNEAGYSLLTWYIAHSRRGFLGSLARMTGVDAPDGRGRSAVHEAACRGNVDSLLRLREVGANCSLSSAERGGTVADYLVRFGRTDALGKLMSAGFPLPFGDTHAWSPGTKAQMRATALEVALARLGSPGATAEHRAAVAALQASPANDTALAAVLGVMTRGGDVEGMTDRICRAVAAADAAVLARPLPQQAHPVRVPPPAALPRPGPGPAPGLARSGIGARHPASRVGEPGAAVAAAARYAAGMLSPPSAAARGPGR